MRKNCGCNKDTSMKKTMPPFMGRESKREERMEKKLPPAAYRKGEKKEGAKSTSKKSK